MFTRFYLPLWNTCKYIPMSVRFWQYAFFFFTEKTKERMKELLFVWPWIIFTFFFFGKLFGHGVVTIFRYLRNSTSYFHIFQSNSLAKIQKQFQFVFMSKHNPISIYHFQLENKYYLFSIITIFTFKHPLRHYDGITLLK